MFIAVGAFSAGGRVQIMNVGAARSLTETGLFVSFLAIAGCAPRGVAPTRSTDSDQCGRQTSSVDNGPGVGMCFENLGMKGQAAQTYREVAAKATTIATRKQSLVALARLGEKLAVPNPGTCADLQPAFGCDRTYHACAVEWSCSGSCLGARGIALQVFSYNKPQSAEIDMGCELDPAGPDNDSTVLATQVESTPPFFYSVPDSVTILLSSEEELVSSRDVCVPSDGWPSPPPRTTCQVVAANACQGRVGLVCATTSDEVDLHHEVGEFWVQPAT